MKRFILLLSVLCLSAALLSCARADALKYWIGVDKQAQRVTIYSTEDDHVVYRWKCSTGLDPSTTPDGVYTLPRKTSSYERTAKMMYGMNGQYFIWGTRITRLILFHSYLFNGNKSYDNIDLQSVRDLGKPASHGCIRLGIDEAKWIALNCPEGTKTVIHTGTDDPLLTSQFRTGTPSAPDTDLANAPQSVQLLLNGEPVQGTVVIQVGEKLRFQAVTEPAGADTTLKWTVYESKKLSVTADGVLEGKRSGYGTLSVFTSNGLEATVRVEVNDPDVARKIELDPGVFSADPLVLDVGDSMEIGCVLTPSTARNKVTWKTSNRNAVIRNGTLTARREGACIVTARTDNGLSVSVRLKITDTRSPRSVTLDVPKTVTLNLGDTLQLTPSVLPDTAQTTLTWSSSQKKTASVDQHGLVTPLKTGRAVITVRTANGKSAKVTVQVVDPRTATSLRLTEKGTIRMEVGDTLQLHAELLPVTAVAALRWTSSSPSKAAVDANGLVTARKPGRVQIRVRTGSRLTATVTVQIVAKAQTVVSATPTDLNGSSPAAPDALPEGGTATLTDLPPC